MKRNLIYLLTNTSKNSGRRFYIGSKQESSIEEFDGVMTILNREDKPYYSSTTSYEMLEDFRNGDIFEASVLEYVPNREDLIYRENEHIKKCSAVESEEYYNKAYAILNAHYDPDSVANKYGETLAQLSSRNSSWSKRDGRSKECGFSNFGEMYFWIHDQKIKGRSGRCVSEELGKERHFAYRTIKNMDIPLAKKQVEDFKGTEVEREIKTMVYNNCSPVFACEVLGLEIAAGRFLLGDFKERDNEFVAALKRGMTREELEKRVVQHVFDSEKVGNGFKNAAKELNLSLETVRRYFIRYVKNNMERPT
tara:strand:+ start:2597 stop:3520 length:924 start_codon:yes stop_codon:yes gene_type:complete